MKNDYKKKRDAQQTSGAGRHDWPFFDAMDTVLGIRHATEPPITIDTTASVHQKESHKEPEGYDEDKEASEDQLADKPSSSQSSPSMKEAKGKSPLKKMAKLK